MTVTYQTERLRDTMGEINAMLPDQWAEMAQGFDAFQTDPQWNLYLMAEDKGVGLLMTAREAGALVGYFGVLIHPHLSTKATLAATSTPYYVVKRRDRGLVLRSLIRNTVKLLKARGVQLVAIRTHVWASAAPILESLKFRPIETSYMLELKE